MERVIIVGAILCHIPCPMFVPEVVTKLSVVYDVDIFVLVGHFNDPVVELVDLCIQLP